MDLFILDSLLRRTAVLDQYESLVWAERYSSVGDFELNILSNFNTRTLLVPGTNLAVNESTRMMTVETVVDKIDDDGRALLNIKGPSFETILDERVARDVVTSPQPQNSS